MPSDNCAPDSTPPNKTIGDIVGEAFRQETFQAALKEACRGKTPEQIVQEGAMAVPMLLALTICPALLGTQEAIRQSQSKTKREEHRARRCNLVVSCVKQSIRSRDIHGRLVVLKDNKLWITTAPPEAHDEDQEVTDDGYPFSGYYLPYPGTQYEGLVSTISDNPPMLNWIYVDRNTYELKYGLRTDAQEHLTGPFDCTRQDRRMTLEGWEGFVAVEDYPGMWALYFDRDDDGLVTKVPMGTRVLEVELTRREKKERKPAPDPNQAQTLDDMMKQHKEQSEREEREKEKEKEELFHDDEQRQLHEHTTSAVADPPERTIEDSSPNSDGLEITSMGIEKLKLGDNVSEDAHEQSLQATPTAASSSANSDNFSFWSAEKKTDDSGDVDSVIATSSVGVDCPVHDSPIPVYRRPGGYMKPYVEDGPGHEPVNFSAAP
ncbi:hypothetical protein SAMD00023353_4700210 [Rosellinia necatrix]|uniref:Uncharacterized protein n=1 Tax=Rosellinia necatrix TaxID=77044 RepID=A0A1W2TQN3_ROSNE|nr:hypothetical protein SAMD00023353_4700210 [Rosellinia necatrix]